MKKALTFFNYFMCSGFPIMSVLLDQVIVPINILLKSFKTSGSSISILSTWFDPEITSDRINLESN